MLSLDDTIAALASPPGGAARGIVRLSGPGVAGCLHECFRQGDREQPQGDTPNPFTMTAISAPRAISGSLRLPDITSPLPCDLYLWPAGRSYTGQAVAEIHTFGSPPLLEAALRTLCAAGARLAGPGEFTLRAFLSGRIDLTQVEAVLGVIDATDRVALDVALEQLAGGLAGPLHGLRNTLLELLAHLEAGLDFAEEDLPFIAPQELQHRLRDAAQVVDRLVQQMSARSHCDEKISVVFVGRPNTGKSSLFNTLSGSLALVSHHPGTTRDYLTATLDLDGVRCRLVDTAGLGDAGPRCPSFPAAVAIDLAEVQQAAEAAAIEQHRRAQGRILCLDCTRSLDDWEEQQLAATGAGWQLVVMTKSDLCQSSQPDCPADAILTSSVTGEGLDTLRAAIRRSVLAGSAAGGPFVAATAVRCRESLRTAADSLGRALSVAETGHNEELVAAGIRVALEELGKVVGEVYTEDLLDRIFSRFCIGK